MGLAGRGAYPDNFQASYRPEFVQFFGSAPPDFSQEEGRLDAFEEIPVALVSQGSLSCLQNRKRPFQEHQRQKALLCVSGASGAAGLSFASGQVGQSALLDLAMQVPKSFVCPGGGGELLPERCDPAPSATLDGLVLARGPYGALDLSLTLPPLRGALGQGARV